MPVLGSNEDFLNAMEYEVSLVPGPASFPFPVTAPVTVLPSHFSSTVTGLRSLGDGPQSPFQRPVRGSGAVCAPDCAEKTANIHKQVRPKSLSRIGPPRFLKMDAQLSLEAARLIPFCRNDPERRGAIDVQNGQSRAWVIEHIRGIHSELKAFDPSGFTDLKCFGKIRIEVPGARQFDSILAKIASHSRFRILQNDRPQ